MATSEILFQTFPARDIIKNLVFTDHGPFPTPEGPTAGEDIKEAAVGSSYRKSPGVIRHGQEHSIQTVFRLLEKTFECSRAIESQHLGRTEPGKALCRAAEILDPVIAIHSDEPVRQMVEDLQKVKVIHLG
jgi:hypothetical protein